MKPVRFTERHGAPKGSAFVPASFALLATAAVGVTFGAGRAHAQISFAGSYTQNFDTLASTGTTSTFTDNTTLLGFYARRSNTGTSVTTPLLVGNGSSNTGGLYSFGSTGSSERALGSIGSGNAAVGDVSYGVQIQNTSGSVIDSLTISYTGEQWRNGGNTTAHILSFAYFNAGASNANVLNGTSYTNVAALNFTSLQNTATAGELNGNLAANSTAITSTITGLNLQVGQYLWLRWTDPDTVGTDHALAIDNLSLSATVTPPVGGAAPEPATLALLLPALPFLGVLAKRRRS